MDGGNQQTHHLIAILDYHPQVIRMLRCRLKRTAKQVLPTISQREMSIQRSVVAMQRPEELNDRAVRGVCARRTRSGRSGCYWARGCSGEP
jgi:hypothetical protein